ncbi:syntaxin-8 [Histomonas meleagridis]|uniref:syntaxin-8 n=1 Tax=Histomonas meleagridis TaxID=135588 RepID=UPI00355A7453|nr:syntaxin-8 [Histomonas meleagridis]KAH0797933.1 syntaxin-8 [Histomonas meleagridis]
MSNAELHAQTQQNFQLMDNRIDALAEISSQLKVSANSIGNELEEQNQMLKETNQNMDRAQVQVDKANEAVLKVKATAGNCIPWILSIVLVVAIVLVWIPW